MEPKHSAFHDPPSAEGDACEVERLWAMAACATQWAQRSESCAGRLAWEHAPAALTPDVFEAWLDEFQQDCPALAEADKWVGCETFPCVLVVAVQQDQQISDVLCGDVERPLWPGSSATVLSGFITKTRFGTFSSLAFIPKPSGAQESLELLSELRPRFRDLYPRSERAEGD